MPALTPNLIFPSPPPKWDRRCFAESITGFRGLQQFYSPSSCQFHAVPAEVPPMAAGSSCSGWLAELCLAPERRFKGSDFLSGGCCSLLCRISLRVTNSNYLFFWWTEGSESACSDGSEEKPGISKTCSRKGNFSLALSSGQCAKTVKASERVWSPHRFASPENMEELPFSREFRRQILVMHSLLKLMSAISVQVNEILLKEYLSPHTCNALISSHH